MPQTETGGMQAVLIREHGGSDVLSYEDTPDPVLADGEVLVEVEAAALNHLDIDLRDGTARIPLEFPHILGCEGVGRIKECHRGASDAWKSGDRVMILEELPCGVCNSCLTGHQNRCEEGEWIGVSRQGTYADLIAVPSTGLLRLPEERSAEEWASTQAAFGTAWHMLVTRGRVQPGEWVLINAVGSGIGSAALEIALFAGAQVIATAGSAEKLERARAMGAAHTVNYSSDDLASAVRELTGGIGVSLVYDHVGGTVLTSSLKAVRAGGRVVTCGAHGGEVVTLDVIELFRSEITVIGSRTFTLPELETVVELVGRGSLHPIVDSVMPLSQAADAHERMEARRQFGKIVVVPDERFGARQKGGAAAASARPRESAA